MRANETAHADGSQTTEHRTITLGLVPSPGLAEDIANDISNVLARQLSEEVNHRASWDIRVATNPLTGTDLESPDLVAEIDKVVEAHDWDYVIAITDLPIRHKDRIVIADNSHDHRAAWISIPALGPFALRRRVREMVVQLVRDLSGNLASEKTAPSIDPGVASRQVDPRDDDRVDTRYVAPGFLGRLRLIGGMVYANEPWTTFPSFKTTAVTAVATGSYGLIFTSLWELGSAYSVWRLIGLMLLAMTILGSWIVVTHRLWQRSTPSTSRYMTTLYNATTIVTVASGIVFAYALIYAMLLVESAVFMPPSLLESKLQQPVSPLNYAAAAWVTASVATLAGALGASLEDTEAVRRATFGWRQRRRLEEYEQSVKEDEQRNQH